jgi:transcriptional regulator with XRE-family HTH domain
MKEKTHNNLRLLRILHGDLSQKYVAYKIEVSQPAYSKMEREELTISKKVLNNICAFYCLENHEIIFLPQEEIKNRFLNNNLNLHQKIN